MPGDTAIARGEDDTCAARAELRERVADHAARLVVRERREYRERERGRDSLRHLRELCEDVLVDTVAGRHDERGILLREEVVREVEEAIVHGIANRDEFHWDVRCEADGVVNVETLQDIPVWSTERWYSRRLC